MRPVHRTISQPVQGALPDCLTEEQVASRARIRVPEGLLFTLLVIWVSPEQAVVERHCPLEDPMPMVLSHMGTGRSASEARP